MSWEMLKAPRPAYLAASVTMSLCIPDDKIKRRYRAHVTVTFRAPELLVLPWLALDRRVDLLLGTGEHAGRLRIVPGTAEALKKVRFRDRNTYVAVISPVLAAALSSAATGALLPFQGAPCDYDYGDDWIEVDLPRIARGAPPASATILPKAVDARGLPTPVRTTPAAPFRGIAARTGVAGAPAAGRAPL